MKRQINILLLLLSTMVFAQQHRVEGIITLAQNDGLHKLLIPHEVRSYLQSDISDFRIWDTQGNQVPYFVQDTQEKTIVSNFKEFSIIGRTRVQDTSTTIVFENPNKTIHQAVLLIANYQESKEYSLEGSNDQNEWFGIVNSRRLRQLNSTSETSVFKVIRFPLCSYTYLKIVFDDRNSLPINLLKIGEATTETMEKRLDEIPVETIQYLEKENKTRIHIRFERPEIINQVNIEIGAPNFYNRKATLFTMEEREVKQKVETYRQQILNFTIHSDRETQFKIPTFFEKEVYLEIENQDNPKLEIEALYFMQKPLYVVASLKKNENYTITGGDDTYTIPHYDISDFKNQISENLPEVKIGFLKFQGPEVVEKEVVSIWQRPWFMWGCIGLAGVVIAYFASNLLKELNQKE